jgi:hypothetical protein
MKVLGFLLVGSIVLSACSSPVTGMSSLERKEDTKARIVFAGNLANGEGCGDHGTEDQCDLFIASIDLKDGSVEWVEQLTDTPQSESYPVWNPNGDFVYYSIFKTVQDKDVGYVNIEAGETGVLVEDATWPEVSPDGKWLLYVENGEDMIMKAALDEDGLGLTEVEPLTGDPKQHDPDFSSDGHFVIFNDTSGKEGHGSVFDLLTGKTVSYTGKSGHCTFAALSTLTLCDNAQGGGIFSSFFEGDALGEMTLFVADRKPSELAVYDPSLAVCDGTSFNYPTFCADDEHLLVSTSCNQDHKVIFSRLFLIDLSGEETAYYPLGLDLAQAYAGPGESTWTVDCLPGAVLY